MKIICTQENLKAGLATVGRIISSANTLPILNNILIKTENGTLKIFSTNLEIAITTQVRCKVEEEGEVTVVGKTINELVTNLPNKNIILQTQNNNELKIETENYHTSIKTLPAEEFPLIPKVEGKNTIIIDSQELKNSIDQVVFAASNNQTQPEISGVYFSQEKNTLKIVATDRYRLAEKKLLVERGVDGHQEAIIPQKTVLEISRIISNQKSVVEMVFSETQVSATINETQIISRLVDGQYPDYNQIIPHEFSTTTITQKQSLINALRTTAVFSQNNNSVSLTFDPEKQTLVLKAESTDLGNSSVELPSKIDGKQESIILNHKYVLDCLSSTETSNVIIKVNNDNSPSLIVPEEKDNYLYLVMPIKS